MPRFLAAVFVGLSILLGACGGRAEAPSQDLAIYGQIADFSFQNQNEVEVSRTSLDGKVWVADFFFTRCPTICKRLSLAMKDLAERTPAGADVAFVSFTVDPDYDQPPILRKYADTLGLPLERWSLTQGSRSALADLCRNSFQLALGEEMDEEGNISHSAKFVLVDKTGRIRGWFSGLDKDEAPALDSALARLRMQSLLSDEGLPRLPLQNACLNGIAFVLLILGWIAIRRKRESLHKALMISAFACSVAFLVGYIWHHATAPEMSVPFAGPVAWKPAYLAFLLTHTILAACVPFLALRTIFLGLRDRREEHRRLAKKTLPIWLYVSVTGVLIFLILYQWTPSWENVRLRAAMQASSAEADGES